MKATPKHLGSGTIVVLSPSCLAQGATGLRCPFFTLFDLLLFTLFCGGTVAAVPGIKVNGANLIEDIVG